MTSVTLLSVVSGALKMKKESKKTRMKSVMSWRSMMSSMGSWRTSMSWKTLRKQAETQRNVILMYWLWRPRTSRPRLRGALGWTPAAQRR